MEIETVLAAVDLWIELASVGHDLILIDEESSTWLRGGGGRYVYYTMPQSS